MDEQAKGRRPESADGVSRPRKKRRRRKRSVVGQILFTLWTLFLVFAISCSFLACFAAVYIKNVIMPNTELTLTDYSMSLSSTIYYTDPNTGAEIEYEALHGDQNRVWIRYDQIPKNLINATVALEDRRFEKHHGVDWLSTAKGVLTMFTGGNIRGGSTLTQQLIKNVTQYDDVTVKRKVQEIFTALEFEKKYEKKQILEWYLNYVYFGRKCYGAYTAAYMYFGKDISQLSLAECASLIAITNNPSLYDPYTNEENNHMRRNQCLEWMYKEGYISEAECDAAKKEVIDFHSADITGKEDTNYTWYTEQVITDVMNDLMKQYGYSETVAHDIVYSGGLKIYACVDPDVQAAVDSVYSNAENLPYTSPSGQQLQSAIVVVDPQGNVSALAGKMGEKTSEDTRGYNLATRAMRQPGSSIKPLSVYAPALEMGLITPNSVFEDSPFMLVNDSPWPSNVNNRYLGQMSVSYAVANSTNTVAVRVLEQVTPAVSYEYLVTKFGVDPDHLVTKLVVNGQEKTDLGYSQMALGGLTRGVTTMDMAGAYSVFPRNGVYVKPRTYSRVVDANGKTILTRELTGEAVLKEKTTYYINELLKGVVSVGGGYDARLNNMTVAGKTGSTTSNNDRWFVGYTPYYTAAVWVGYQTPERVTAGNGVHNPAAQLWSQVMGLVHEDLEDKPFASPGELVTREYCMDTGLLATEECRSDMRGSRVARGYYYPEDVPTQYCQAHVMVEVCTAAPTLGEDGGIIGPYHLAGKYCPDVEIMPDGSVTQGRISVSILDVDREYIGDVHPGDDAYFLSSLEAAGACDVHTDGNGIPDGVTTTHDPKDFDITNPSTWPTREENPNFDPGDPSTWPSAGGHLIRPGNNASVTNTPNPSPTPVPTLGPMPWESSPPAAHTPAPTSTPTPTHTPTPAHSEDEPLLPPGH